MNFSDFIGNKVIKDVLQGSITKGRVANAYLFAGPEGLGKRYLALICARALLCSDYSDESCGVCNSCLRLERMVDDVGFHSDLHILEPDGRYIKVDQIRDELISDTQFQPHESRHQVFIVDPAEAMHPSAANAFLKTLEEPPGSSVFFLISVNPSSLLPTIRSRCQQFNFQRLPSGELAEELCRRGLYSKDDAMLVAALSRGAIGSALNFDLEYHRAEREIALQFVDLALGNEGLERIFEHAAVLSRDSEKFPDRLELSFTLLRDIMLLSSAGSATTIINKDIETRLIDLARGRSPRKLARLISKIAEMRDPLIRNVRIDSVTEQVMLTGRGLFTV